jgi:dTDP-glucose 4,6-dehydratase
MTILVTGGAGFIGSNFVNDWLLQCNEPIINLDKLTYAGNLENLTNLSKNKFHFFVHGCIGDSALVTSLLREHKPRAIINFAAESHVDRSIDSPNAFIETNIVSTFNFLENTLNYWRALEKNNKQEFKFVHISTDEVYGSLLENDPAFTERNPYMPNSPYSATKAASDHLVRAYHHTFGLPTITTNCSNNYGPYQFPEKLIPLVIVNALNNQKLPIYGDGEQIRDWLYVKDHCSAIIKVLNQGKIGDVYNIGGNSEKTNISIVQTICDLLDDLVPRPDGKLYSDLIEFVQDRPGHDRRYAINASKISDDLGWKPKETFDTGIKKTVEWYLQNQNWIESVKSGAYRNWIMKQYNI